MAAEYQVVEGEAASMAAVNALAAEGWTVKQAFAPDHFLLERVTAEPVFPAIARVQPHPPTGPGRDR